MKTERKKRKTLESAFFFTWYVGVEDWRVKAAEGGKGLRGVGRGTSLYAERSEGLWWLQL